MGADQARSAGESRTLAVGDRIAARPCFVTIESVGIGGAVGQCETCRAEHVIDRHRYERGHGPWRPLPEVRHNGGSAQ